MCCTEHTGFWLLLFCPVRCVATRHGAENDDIGDRITADTVTTMQTTSYFTGRKHTRNHVTVYIQHFSISVNGDTTHSMMHARRNTDRVERAFMNRVTQRRGAAKVFIMLFFNEEIIAF